MFETKKYIITTAAEIPFLGGITGPITTPVKISDLDLIWLINNKFTVYQCNPYDDTDRVLVTRTNMYDIKFTRNRAIVTKERNERIKGQEFNKPIEQVKKEVDNIKEEKKETKVVEPDKFQKK